MRFRVVCLALVAATLAPVGCTVRCEYNAITEAPPMTPGTRVRVRESGRVGVIVEPLPEPQGANAIKASQPEAWAAIYGRPGDVVVMLEPTLGQTLAEGGAGGLGAKRVCLPPSELEVAP